jgi:hypothetical protein
VKVKLGTQIVRNEGGWNLLRMASNVGFRIIVVESLGSATRVLVSH